MGMGTSSEKSLFKEHEYSGRVAQGKEEPYEEKVLIPTAGRSMEWGLL